MNKKLGKYLPSTFESTWSETWEKEHLYRTPTSGEKMYVLGMFPYPSGAGLHVGHVRIYTATDVLARFYRMNGKQVLFPMGWDAFGLPTENFAIKTGIKPQVATDQNIITFKRQMNSVGFSYDWEKEVNTTDPNYYKWTQWLFQQLYKQGLVYRKDIPINWCPKCKTGLADEEVLADGTHERCGTPVEKRHMPQWLMKITAYADRLLNDLDGLDWPTGILEMQRNWIGRSEGTEIQFQIVLDSTSFHSNNNSSSSVVEKSIKVFTTRVDTIYGVTALVIAPEHELIKEIVSGTISVEKAQKDALAAYVLSANHKSEMERTQLEKEKTGVFTGLYAIHPLTKEEIPVWVADYVIGSYGEGAVMLVPAHDKRDHAFAMKYDLPRKTVIVKEVGPLTQESSRSNLDSVDVFTDYGVLVNSGEFTGKASKETIKLISSHLKEHQIGGEKVSFKLRDWIFSRQRYWGEPFPVVFCEKCGDENGIVLVPEDQLPVTLPDVEKYEPTDNGMSPLSTVTDWVNTTCPTCGGPAKRETDTMPNWAGSSWYFLAFARSGDLNSKSPNIGNWKLEIGNYAETLMPVDWYLGGAEHAVLHLLYARFWQKVFMDIGLTTVSEPFARLRRVGMVGGPDGRKMSKSFGNVINPDDVVKEYGADTLRVYEMFMGPWSQDLPWDTKGVQGAYRFLKRIWDLSDKVALETNNYQLSTDDISIMHKTIKKVTEDTADLKFNTAISSMMEWLNHLSRKEIVSAQEYEVLVQLVSPYAPFMSEELWQIGKGVRVEGVGFSSVHIQKWPSFDEKYLQSEFVTVAIQVNGKLRDTIEVEKAISAEQHEIEAAARRSEKVQKFIDGFDVRKVIYVPGKILNFVV